MLLSAVSYLNTRPLVWGLLHGAQKGQAKLEFDLPAVCADRLERREVDAGLVPVIEASRQHLAPVGDLGIACKGPVRSILLLSKKPVREIRRLALDTSSRSSVMLARVILANQYNVEPDTVNMAPDLASMLGAADAALVIGDPALRIQPETTGLHWLDLGEEWWKMTGLPMVFAIWAGHEVDMGKRVQLAEVLRNSYDYGRQHIDAIVAAEAKARAIAPELAHEYLTRTIRYELDNEFRRGLHLYLDEAAKMEERLVTAK